MSLEAKSQDDQGGLRRAWDLPTRLFHWALVGLVASAWGSATFAESLKDPTYTVHRWCGYGVLIVVLWRGVWGFVGGETSRFASFIKGPGAALGYGVDLLRGRTRHFLGHNPLGAYMVVALLVVVLGQAVLGLFTVEHNDLASGPLARLVDEDLHKPIRRWHHFLFDRVLLGLIGVHVAANLAYAVLKRDPLIRAMITGTKPEADFEDSVRVANRWGRGLVVLGLCAAIVLGGIVLTGGRL